MVLQPMKHCLLLLLFIVAVVAPANASSDLLGDLICSTNLTVGDLNIPDEADVPPLVVLSHQDTPFVFGITDKSLGAQVFVKILTTTATFTGYDWTGAQTGNVLTIDDVGKAITVQPGEFVGCAGQPGCDGFSLDAIAFKKLFPANTSYVLFVCTLKYSSNGTVTLLKPFHMLGFMQPQAADTVIGTVGPVTTNITFASTIKPSSGPASSSSLSTATIIGLSVGLGTPLLILLILWLRWCWTHPKMGGDEPLKDGREFGSSSNMEMGAKYSMTVKSASRPVLNYRLHAAKNH